MYNKEKVDLIKEEIGKVIVGKNNIIESVMAAILAGGHVLLEDVPGVGKTTLAMAFSKAMGLEYRRTQFTPDVLPSDVTGFYMYNKKTNEFEYKQGSVFCNLFLADEINRTSPKTQAALLEVMEEGKVTVDGVTRELPRPFTVIATQNPMGYVGTQKLPESQLDRFMIKLSMGYPDFGSEMMIYQGNQYSALETVNQVISHEEILGMINEVENILVKLEVYDYITRLVRASRKSQYVELGLSPRGGIALVNMAKATAYLNGRDFVTPDDVIKPLEDVALHRLVLNGKAKANGRTEKDVLQSIKESVEING